MSDMMVGITIAAIHFAVAFHPAGGRSVGSGSMGHSKWGHAKKDPQRRISMSKPVSGMTLEDTCKHRDQSCIMQ